MTILLVRFHTELPAAKLAGRLADHRARCQTVPGLTSVVFGRETASDDLCGIYTFTDESALQGFQRSEAAQLLPTSLEVSDVRMDVIEELRPESEAAADG